MSQKSNDGAQIPDATPELFMRNNDIVPEAEDGEVEEGVEQGEPQPALPDVPAPSQGQDDGETPHIVPEVRRSDRKSVV